MKLEACNTIYSYQNCRWIKTYKIGTHRFDSRNRKKKKNIKEIWINFTSLQRKIINLEWEKHHKIKRRYLQQNTVFIEALVDFNIKPVILSFSCNSDALYHFDPILHVNLGWDQMTIIILGGVYNLDAEELSGAIFLLIALSCFIIVENKVKHFCTCDLHTHTHTHTHHFLSPSSWSLEILVLCPLHKSSCVEYNLSYYDTLLKLY